MNTCYSNLMEGQNKRPQDVERSLAVELGQEEGRRNLQLEAAAHMRVEAEIDRLAVNGAPPGRGGARASARSVRRPGAGLAD